ncbi:hypothetical protein BHM03_00024837 [Ensete ventricosum]|nr:hypothetical protein BHM03_00024837 [Ensete ventricosum]
MLLTGKSFFRRIHYEVLSVKEHASYDEIRASYKTAILNSHPDKLKKKSEAFTDHQQDFLDVQKAWEVLSDSTSRANYDKELQLMRQELEVPANEIELGDMSVESVGDFEEFFYECRCGDYFSITWSELKEIGIILDKETIEVHSSTVSLPASVLIPCGSCSLKHPVPAAHEDSWTVLRWVAGQAGGGGPAAEAWLAERADFERVFLAGESAGGNIAHHMAMRAGIGGLPCGVRIRGVALIHPYFLGSDVVESAEIYPEATESLETLWRTVCPSSSGLDDPMINPAAEAAPSLAGLGCGMALVCVGGADALRDRGRAYYRRLRESGWGGAATLFEAEGKAHTFHLFETDCEEAIAQHVAVCSFLNL